MTVSKQHEVGEKNKDVDAERNGLCWTIRDGKQRLIDNKMDAGCTKCQHFSIRGYVARTREINGNICWPFPQHLLETQSQEEGNVALPPLEVRQHKWWNCRKCLDDTNSSSGSLVEKNIIKNFRDSLVTYDGNSDPGCLTFGMQFPTPNADLQLFKENTLNQTEMAECRLVELKSKYILSSSPSETEKDKRHERVVTEEPTEHCRNERIVSMDLQGGKSETRDATEEKSGMPQCLSKRDERVVTEEAMEHCRNEQIVSMDLQEGKSETADATEKKSGIPQCLSKSEVNIDKTEKHCHEQEREKVCADTGQPIVQITPSILVNEVDDELGSKESKSDAFQNVHHSSNSWEYFSRSKNIFEQISKKVREKETGQATSQIVSLVSENCDVDHSVVDANKLENISITPGSLCYDKNVLPVRLTLAEENNMEAMSEKVIKPSTIKTLESNVKVGDCSLKASDERNNVPSTNSTGVSDLEHRDRSNLTEGKECADLPRIQESLDTGNVLLIKQTEKSKVTESKNKKKSQKKRSIADIIASDSSVLESCKKEIEESNSADIMEENICQAENHEQFPVQEDRMKVLEDAAKASPKSRLETSSTSEVFQDADVKNVTRKKRRPEKLKVQIKHGTRVQSWDAYSTLFSKDSSNHRKCDAVSNMIQMPQAASNFVQPSRDKALQDSSVHHVDVKIRQRCSEMDDDIPMDVVELMAKNQRERGLSKLRKTDKSKKDYRRVRTKVKGSDVNHANKPIAKKRTSSKQEATIPKSLAQPEKAIPANLQAYLRNHITNNTSGEDSQVPVSQTRLSGEDSQVHVSQTRLSGEDSQVHVSQTRSIGQSFISDMEATKSGCPKNHSATLQSSQWFNSWGRYPNYMVPLFSGTVACNPPPSIVDGSNTNVAMSGFDQRGTFCTNDMAPASLQVPGAAARDSEYLQAKNLYSKDTTASSEYRNPVVFNFQNNSQPSLHCTGVSTGINPNLNLSKTDIPIPTSGNSDLHSGPTFNIPFQNHNGKGISILSGKRDGVPFPAYFEGQSNSALLQQVNAQARPMFGNKHSIPVSSAPVLRLMGQSVPVPVNCGIKHNSLTDNKNKGTFSELLQASSQKHVTWFHPVACASSGVSCGDRVFNTSPPTQDSMCIKEQSQSSKPTIPPVPKFFPVHLVSNGHSGTPASSCTAPGKDVLESSIANKQFPFQGASLFLMQQKNGLQCTNDYNGHLQTFCTLPPTSQTTEVVKIASPTKGLRSHRPPPSNVHLNRFHTAATEIYHQNSHQHPQSFSITATIPKQRQEEDADKAKGPNLNKEYEKSALFRKRSCNAEICTLNQNPAEIIVDDGENTDSFGYEHLASALKAISHTKGKGNIQVPNGQKRRRALKKKYMQEFLDHKNGHVSDQTDMNVGTVRQEVTTAKQLAKTTTYKYQSFLTQK